MNIPSFDPEKNYGIYIEDILESIRRIEEYCHGLSEPKFSQDIQLQDAVVRRFQVIGEAAGKIPKEKRTQFPEVPWAKIVALRNLIIHDYASVDFSEVWRVVHEELPTLKSQLFLVQKNLEEKT